MHMVDASIIYEGDLSSAALDDEFLDVARGGVVVTGQSPKAKVALYEWDDDARRMRRIDQVIEATVETDDKDTVITGKSLRASRMFGAANNHAVIRCIPGKGCANCGGTS